MGNASFAKALGHRVLSEANDLKRTPEALAKELGVPLDHVLAVIEGRAGEEGALDLVQAMANAYPVSLSDLWVDRDDPGALGATDRDGRFTILVRLSELDYLDVNVGDANLVTIKHKPGAVFRWHGLGGAEADLTRPLRVVVPDLRPVALEVSGAPRANFARRR